ncbi:MAG: FAD-dependent oxidoreductase [Syntrophales bacterium]|nr:FAD-dependent oxidoreductase [Syntrophales bacterium]
MSELNNILSPITLKKMEIPNRVVMPPMGTELGNADGTVSEATIAYLKRRARGGPGLIITEIVAAHPDGIANNKQIRAYDDRYIPSLAKLASVAHKAGSRIFMQIHHAGRESLYMLRKGRAVGPSAIPSLIYQIPPREMTVDDIGETIAAFGSAARRAREAGFDGVELHGAHGYLLTQFLSTLSNQRTDEYGGTTLKQRARFVVEVIRTVRGEVGDNFPVSIRISTEEFINGGYTADDMQTILPDFVAAGVDIVHASFGTHGSPGSIAIAPIEYKPGFNAWLARKVKDVAGVPVIAVGRFSDPALADEVIGRGDADMVAFGRQFLADPDFLIKAREGRSTDIRTCLACNQGCIERVMLGEGNIRCAINPETGQETIYPEGPTENPKNVWVVGGGPAGLTAAFEAARLGHTVTLYERAEELGGQIRYARKPPHKAVYGDWIDWLIGQVKKARITIVTGTEVTPVMLSEESPEAVILATGGEKIRPEIAGIDGPHVCDAWQILGGTVKPGKNALVIGGGLIGMETADYLSEQGSKVTLVEMLKSSPVQESTAHGYMLHGRLRDKDAILLFSTTVQSIGDRSVDIETAGEKSTVSPIDQVVVAVGLKPRDHLTEVLKEAGIPYTVIGDASSARRIIEATEEGARAAWEL